MSDARWHEIDSYIQTKLLNPDDVLADVLAANKAAGLPSIDVSPAQGRLLTILVRMMGARRILEIGTLGGYSTICLARGAGAEGHVVTLEYNPQHAAVARRNFARAGLEDRITLHEGAALDSLKGLAPPPASFDFVFIDADKANNRHYLDWACKLTRRGGVIVCDNVVREGKVLDAQTADPAILGTRDVYDALSNAPDLTSTVIQTVGNKGWDGFAIALVE